VTDPTTTPGPEQRAAAKARREELLREHAAERLRRDNAPLGGEEYRHAAIRIADIEVEIARIERDAGLG
jgi:hypothetical protein